MSKLELSRIRHIYLNFSPRRYGPYDIKDVYKYFPFDVRCDDNLRHESLEKLIQKNCSKKNRYSFKFNIFWKNIK